MKSIASATAERNKLPVPCLYVNHDNTFIVMVTEWVDGNKFRGVVVWTDKHKPSNRTGFMTPPGDYWLSSCFKPYNGRVVLENDEGVGEGES